MKKALIILATVIIATLMAVTTVSACESEYHNEEIVNKYVESIESGYYYHSSDSFFATVINGQEIYQTYDGLLIYNGNCICSDIPELISIDSIILIYEEALNNGNYYTTADSKYTVNINDIECYIEISGFNRGAFVYDGYIILNNIEDWINYNPLKNYISEYYVNQIKAGNYIERYKNKNNVVIADNFDIYYITSGGMFACNDTIIYDSLATKDKPIGNIVCQFDFTAVTLDGEFYYFYYLGEVIHTFSILNGMSPRG